MFLIGAFWAELDWVDKKREQSRYINGRKSLVWLGLDFVGKRIELRAIVKLLAAQVGVATLLLG